jgi:nucleoside-diphosphate-sugar epimerase
VIALVTGASGFIGSHLVDALVADGVDVRLLRRSGHTAAAAPRGTTAHHVDLAATDAHLAPVWRGVTHVFHLAARTRALDAMAFAAANVAPTAQLAAVLARQSAPPRLVFVSSQAAAGPATAVDRPLTDADVARPVDAYGRSKYDAETAVRAQSAAVPAVILRPSAVYGPRDRDFLQVFQQVQRAVALHAVPPWHQLSLVHVSDVVAALRLAAVHANAVGRTFFVSADDPISWGALYDEVAAVMRRSPARLTVPSAVLHGAALGSELLARWRGRDPLLTRAKLELTRHPYWACDAVGLRTTLGWNPAVQRAHGWAQTYAWYQEARWIRA